MRTKDLIAPVAALLAAAAVLFGVSSALGETARVREEAARTEIMAYMLPGRPADFTQEDYDGEDETDAPFLLQFLGTAGEAAVDENIDALTGATVTSKAVTRAVNSAAAFVTGADVSSGATEWEG